ncbi:hypothetical protein MBLNU13_g11235t1 [Cladosporium sp. NU13]
MLRKPSSQLHLPLLALLVFALIISIATLACAASTLRLFESQQGTNPWLLPLWRNHFDLRGLKLVVGTSAAVALFDLAGVVVLVVLAVQLFAVSSSTALLVSALTSLLSACLALPAATLPLVLNARAPGRDTLQSWTCDWVSQGLNTHDGLPGDFGRVCGESRFATYAPLATLFLHLALLALSLAALQKVKSRSSTRADTPGSEDGEKMELEEYKNFPKEDNA